MKNELSLRNMKPVAAALPACHVPPFLQLAHARSQRHLPVVTPAAPRRQGYATEREARAATLAAELADWLATGGDFLSRSAAVAQPSRSGNAMPGAFQEFDTQPILCALRLVLRTQPRSADKPAH